MITHAQFSMQVSYMAGNCSSWAADCLTLPEDHEQPMADGSVMRFLENMRRRLERLEEWHKRSAGNSVAPPTQDPNNE